MFQRNIWRVGSNESFAIPLTQSAEPLRTYGRRFSVKHMGRSHTEKVNQYHFEGLLSDFVYFNTEMQGMVAIQSLNGKLLHRSKRQLTKNHLVKVIPTGNFLPFLDQTSSLRRLI